MDINRALEHFKWRFRNGWKPTENDIKAYNSIVKFKEFHEKESLKNNEALAKLWIEKLILLNESKMYSAERSIQVIDEILQLSTYEWCVKLHSKLSQMRLNSFIASKYNLDEYSSLEPSKMIIENSKIVEKYELDILQILKDDIKLEDIIKLVEKQITRIIQY